MSAKKKKPEDNKDNLSQCFACDGMFKIKEKEYVILKDEDCDADDEPGAQVTMCHRCAAEYRNGKIELIKRFDDDEEEGVYEGDEQTDSNSLSQISTVLRTRLSRFALTLMRENSEYIVDFLAWSPKLSEMDAKYLKGCIRQSK